MPWQAATSTVTETSVLLRRSPRAQIFEQQKGAGRPGTCVERTSARSRSTLRET